MLPPKSTVGIKNNNDRLELGTLPCMVEDTQYIIVICHYYYHHIIALLQSP